MKEVNYLTGISKAKKTTNFFVGLLLSIVSIATILLSSILPQFFVTENSIMEEISGDLIFLSGLFLVFLWIKFIEKREISTLGFGITSKLKKIILGAFCFGLVINIIPLVSFYLLHAITLSVTRYSNILQGIAIDLILFFIVGIQAGTEEVIFRGFLAQVTYSQYRLLPTYVITSVVFSLSHSLGGFTGLFTINALLLGIIFLAGNLIYNTLWFSIIVHTSYNWFQTVIVSDQKIPQPILRLDATQGQKIVEVANGNISADGSWLTTGMLLLIALIFVYKAHVSKKIGMYPGDVS